MDCGIGLMSHGVELEPPLQ